MSPPPTTTTLAMAARAASASTTSTAPPTPAATCNREAMLDLFQIDGLPQDRSVWAMPKWPESLAGMTACCQKNEVHMGGPDGCALWCLIPDEFLFEQVDDGKGGEKNGKRWDSQVVGSAMKQCVRNKGNVTGPHITIWQVKEGVAAATLVTPWSGKMSMTTVLGTVTWGMLVVGLLA